VDFETYPPKNLLSIRQDKRHIAELNGWRGA